VSQKKKIIVSVTNDLFTDQRVRKVCEFLHENDYEVTLVGRKLKNSVRLPKLKYKARRFKLLFNKGPLFYANYNLRLFFFLLFNKADILLSNDLDTLYANLWARKFKSKCKLIYDSHEYYCGVPELVHRPRIQKFWRRIERRCIPQVDEMYTVNNSIADLYRKEYQKEIKVVRNISDAVKPELTTTRKELGLPEDKRIVIFQGAGINIDRGGKEMIEAIQLVDNAMLIFVGDGDVIESLKDTVSYNKLEEKVRFFGKRPYDELMNFTMLSDVGVSMDKDTNINYHYSLPNKIFDYIHAGIPQLVSDLPEVRKIVEGHEVGVICPSHEPEIIAEQLKLLFSDKDLYDRLKHNTSKASFNLNWKNECKVLEEIYL